MNTTYDVAMIRAKRPPTPPKLLTVDQWIARSGAIFREGRALEAYFHRLADAVANCSGLEYEAESLRRMGTRSIRLAEGKVARLTALCKAGDL